MNFRCSRYLSPIAPSTTSARVYASAPKITIWSFGTSIGYFRIASGVRFNAAPVPAVFAS